jgi:Kef-type K+ transport system membrane component KefB
MSVTSILLDLLVLLIAAKIAAEIAERVGVPAVVGEIIAGVIIGPSVLALVEPNQTLSVLGELGVILLLLDVGMEMNLAELSAVGRSSMSVAVVGVVVPTLGGYAVASALGHSDNQSLFIGAALAATSVGITARVFSDLRALATIEARTVLGAAVADDVLGLVILTVVVRLVSEGSVSIVDVVAILLVAIAFLVLTAALGSRFAPGLFHFLDRHARSAGTLVAIALAFTLAFAELADAAQLAPIVGAFVAGLALSGSSASERIQRELAPVGHLFIPVFFLQIGIDAQIDDFVKPAVLGIAGALLVVAVVGKLVAAVGAFGSPGDKRLIGLGMIPRGEVGLIFATIGLREGILGGNLYAALLLVVLSTTLLTPPLLRIRLLHLRPTADGCASTTASFHSQLSRRRRSRSTSRSTPRSRSRTARDLTVTFSIGSAIGTTRRSVGTPKQRKSCSLCSPMGTVARGDSSRQQACSNRRCPSSPMPYGDAAPTRSCSTPPRCCGSRWSSGFVSSRRPIPSPRAKWRDSRAPNGCCWPR